MPVGLVAAGVGAAGAIGSAVIGANAASNSADAVAQAAKRSNALQKQIFDQNAATFKPYVDAGVSALDPLAASYGLKGQTAQDAAVAMFQNAPDYQWSRDQGLQGVEASAAAKGGIYSGGALKALQRYGSDYANNYLNTWRGGLNSLVQTGVGGARDTAQAGKQYADAYGANTMNAGNARATGYQQEGAAITGGIQDLSQIAAYGAGRGWFGGGTPAYNGASTGASGGGAAPGGGNPFGY